VHCSSVYLPDIHCNKFKLHSIYLYMLQGRRCSKHDANSMLLHMRSAHGQDCVAHALHLLIMNDGIYKIPELVDLLHRYKTAVVKLQSGILWTTKEPKQTTDESLIRFLRRYQRRSVCYRLMKTFSWR